MEFTIRELTTHEDFLATVDLQKEAWGKNFRDITSPTLMVINAKIGGFAAGAFDSGGKMQGFVFALPGVMNGENIQWSEKLAVNMAHRGKGLGFRLKAFQREQLLERGYKHIYWTYDPLQALNANLNINRLGVKAVEYVTHWYPNDEQNVLHSGIGTDRFIVDWEIDTPHVRARLEGKFTPALARLPEQDEIVNTTLQNGAPKPVEKSFPNHKTIFVEIPENITAIAMSDMKQAGTWRENTRAALLHYYNKGYQIFEFVKIENRCFYLLESST